MAKFRIQRGKTQVNLSPLILKSLGKGLQRSGKTNRLLEITMNNGTLPVDWKRATVVPIHKGGDHEL
jgi:hypothetical protein